MATRGRKPKPTAMKELEGNPGKHRRVRNGWSRKQKKNGGVLPSRWKPSAS